MNLVIESLPSIHLPLGRVALCLDCEQCFDLGHDVCPACGSGTWTPIARFLKAKHLAESRRLVEFVA